MLCRFLLSRYTMPAPRIREKPPPSSQAPKSAPVAAPISVTGPTDYPPRAQSAPSAEARLMDLTKRIETLEQQVLDLYRHLGEVIELMGKVAGVG
jgi:hypothetical protein